MNIPTPAMMAKRPSLEKQREMELDRQLNELSEKVFSSPESSETTEASRPSNTPKKAFVRKPHLTHRPLMENESLQALKDSLPQNKKQNHKNGWPPKHPKGSSKSSKTTKPAKKQITG